MPYSNSPWSAPYIAGPSFRRALELNWCSWVLAYGEASQSGHVFVEPDNIRLVTGEQSSFLNMVGWAECPPTRADEFVRQLNYAFQRSLPKNGTWCDWGVIGTQAYREQLEVALQGQGWSYSYQVPGMTCDLTTAADLASLESGQFSVERVESEKPVDEWLVPFMEGFELNAAVQPFLKTVFTRMATTPNHPMRHYSVLDGKDVLGTGTIHYDCGVAVIYNITTRPQARKRGIATEMVKALMAAALNDGYRSVSLFALEAGKNVYERLGFRDNGAFYRVYSRSFN